VSVIASFSVCLKQVSQLRREFVVDVDLSHPLHSHSHPSVSHTKHLCFSNPFLTLSSDLLKFGELAMAYKRLRLIG